MNSNLDKLVQINEIKLNYTAIYIGMIDDYDECSG